MSNNRILQPWDQEPDHVSFMHLDGYHVIINRNHLKALCGYVGIPQSHPYYGIAEIYDERLSNLKVHGEVTYSRSGSERNLQSENEELWYIGFDCAHFMDYVPGLVEMLREIPKLVHPYYEDISQYRDIEYVSNEVQQLYDQLKAAEVPQTRF